MCVPDFDKTHSCVLVNLSNLDCQEMKFNTSMDVEPSSKSRGGEMEEEEDSELHLPVEEDVSILNQMDNEDDFED